MKDFYKDVTLEMLPGNARKIAETIGVKAALKLFEKFGGGGFYVPKIAVIGARARAEQIRTEFRNGASTRELAKRYRVTMRMIERVVSKSRGLSKTYCRRDIL